MLQVRSVLLRFLLWKLATMTNPTMQSRRTAAREEFHVFDQLPTALRVALNNCAGQPPKASIVRDALLRGVSQETIIETIERSQDK